jgi:anti-sigma B factor antagonist
MGTSRTSLGSTNGVLPYRATVAELGPDVALVSVSGELDLYAEPELSHSLAAADELGATTVVVDLSGVSFLDSTICGVIVREARRRNEAGGELVLVGNGSQATQALELAGIDRVVRLLPTLHSALETLLVREDRR